MSDAILFLCPFGHVALTPSVRYLALTLAEAGFMVEVLTLENISSPRFIISHQNITVRCMPWRLRKFHEPAFKVIVGFSLWALGQYLRRCYRCVVGVGIRGLYIGAILTLIRRTPLVYHSLELYPSWERRNPLSRVAKAVERWANRRCNFTIIQDELRASILSKDNRVPMNRIVFMPNAAPGKASRIRSSYLREKFSITSEKKIILFAGTLFGRNLPTLSLVCMAQPWPDDWVLVLHSNAILSDVFLNEIRKADSKSRVVLSCEPLDADQIGKLISSADIGLAIYDPKDDNMLNMGLSSGKLAEYLRYGLPVVVSDLRYTADIVSQYNCGIVIDRLESLENAIKIILTNYDIYAENAIRCFNEVWSLDNYSTTIVQSFIKLVR